MIVFGGVKAPRRIEFVAESPRSAAGNVPKRQFRERFREGRERRVTAWCHKPWALPWAAPEKRAASLGIPTELEMP